SACARQGPHRRKLHSGRRGCAAQRHAGNHCAARRPQAAAGAAAARTALSARLWRGSVRALHRQGAVPHCRCLEDVQASYVLLVSQGEARTGFCRAALRARHRGCAELVPRRGLHPMIALLALIPVAVWLYLLAGRGMFWMMQERDDRDESPPPATWPAVVAVVPARNEADVIAQTVASLLAQDYPGSFRVVLVD